MDALNIILTAVSALVVAGIAGIGLYSFGAIFVNEFRNDSKKEKRA